MHNKINKARGTNHVRTPATRRSWRSTTRVASARTRARLTRGIDRSTAPEYDPNERAYINRVFIMGVDS